MKKLLCLILAFVMAVSVFGAVFAEDDSAKAIISVDNTEPKVGDVITVTFRLEDITVKQFVACDAAIFYNTSVLEYDAEYGIVLDEGLKDAGLSQIYTNAEESVVRSAVAFGVNDLDKMPASIEEDIDVWSVKFKVIAEGDTNLQFAVEGVSPKFSTSLSDGVMAFLGENSEPADVEIGIVELIAGEGDPTRLITEIMGVSDVVVPVGSTAEDVIAKLPLEVDVKLDDGTTGKVKIQWTAGSLISGFDGNTAGEYFFTGNITDSGEYVNYNELFSMVKVVVEPVSDGTTVPDNGSDAAESDVKTEIVMVIGSSEPTINGEIASIDVPAMILDDRTMTPARFVAEALGATVEWDSETRTVTITKDEYKIVLVIDSKIAEINGQQVEIDVPATIVDDRTMTPARLVAEALGAIVSWNDATRTVTIVK